jgi:hypothetical protein
MNIFLKIYYEYNRHHPKIKYPILIYSHGSEFSYSQRIVQKTCWFSSGSLMKPDGSLRFFKKVFEV